MESLTPPLSVPTRPILSLGQVWGFIVRGLRALPIRNTLIGVWREQSFLHAWQSLLEETYQSDFLVLQLIFILEVLPIQVLRWGKVLELIIHSNMLLGEIHFDFLLLSLKQLSLRGDLLTEVLTILLPEHELLIWCQVQFLILENPTSLFLRLHLVKFLGSV